MKRRHGTFQTAVEVPRISGVKDVLQLALAGKKLIHLFFILIIFRQTKFLVDFLIFRQGINDWFHAFLNHFNNAFFVIEIGVLSQIAYRITWRKNDLSLIVIVNSCNDFHQGRFSRTVKSDDTDFRTIEEREIYVFENLLVGLSDCFGETNH